jgi:molecular chaperone DnaK
LTEAEIQKLVREAEAHGEEDKKKKELIEARNQADSMAYSAEKNVKEFGDKVDAAEKARIEDAIARVRKVIEGDDINAIKSAQEELTNASHKLAEAMYAKASASQAGAGAGAGAGAHGGPSGEQPGAGKKDEDVVDADFEDVK